MVMKKYYSPLKNYHRIKRPRLFYHFINLFLKAVIGKDDVIWYTEKPKEPAVFIANHTRTYAPLTMKFNFDNKTRPWTNAYTLTYRNGIKLFYNKIAYDLKPRFLVKLLAIITMPIINLYFRSLEPIPVYHDIRIKLAFKKTTETLASGINVIIYPEKNIEPVYKYINDLERGFVHLAHYHYNKTGKIIKFYPVYCCKELKKILIGEPIAYNPEIELKEQREIICKYLIAKINELGDSLPKHKIYMNKVYPPKINKFHF